MKLEPVKSEGKDSILVKMIKGYLTAQCVGFGILIFTTPTYTMGATTKGRAQLKTRYMTSETQDTERWGFDNVNAQGTVQEPEEPNRANNKE